MSNWYPKATKTHFLDHGMAYFNTKKHKIHVKLAVWIRIKPFMKGQRTNFDNLKELLSLSLPLASYQESKGNMHITSLTNSGSYNVPINSQTLSFSLPLSLSLISRIYLSYFKRNQHKYISENLSSKLDSFLFMMHICRLLV